VVDRKNHSIIGPMCSVKSICRVSHLKMTGAVFFIWRAQSLYILPNLKNILWIWGVITGLLEDYLRVVTGTESDHSLKCESLNLLSASIYQNLPRSSINVGHHLCHKTGKVDNAIPKEILLILQDADLCIFTLFDIQSRLSTLMNFVRGWKSACPMYQICVGWATLWTTIVALSTAINRLQVYLLLPNNSQISKYDNLQSFRFGPSLHSLPSHVHNCPSLCFICFWCNSECSQRQRHNEDQKTSLKWILTSL
jgi:hypothetical protein